jgi:organic radical activating enzyme
VLETDPVFYTYIAGLRSPTIYPGLLVDVTHRCQLRCEYCYFPCAKDDPATGFSIPEIVEECRVFRHLAPFILTGGEPTVRADIGDLIKEVKKVGPVELLTNGINMADGTYDYVMPLLIREPGIADIHLSIHRKESDKWRNFITLLRGDSIKLESALIVVESKEDFLHAIKLCKELSDVILRFRIKAAARIWNETKPGTIFISEMIRWLEEAYADVTILTGQGYFNKSVFTHVMCDGLWLMLVSWHTIANVDLHDIECPPYYRAQNGEVRNVVTSFLINEGMQAGWLKGRRYP